MFICINIYMCIHIYICIYIYTDVCMHVYFNINIYGRHMYIIMIIIRLYKNMYVWRSIYNNPDNAKTTIKYVKPY
jgi:hypothetical protein